MQRAVLPNTGKVVVDRRRCAVETKSSKLKKAVHGHIVRFSMVCNVCLWGTVGEEKGIMVC